MPQRRTHLAAAAAQDALAASLAALRDELDAPVAFSPEALDETERAAPPAPDADLREVPFVTLDPAGSRDLDQAFHLAAHRRGYTVRYAIADVPGFVRPGGAVDRAARERGQTLYAVDGRIPLHPPVLSEDRASLLEGRERSALVWTLALDGEGALTGTRLERARVRSRAQLDYVSTQHLFDAGGVDPDGPLALLPEIGRLRLQQERARGGASLNLPDEEVMRDARGHYRIERRHPLAVEEWNAQLSLLTGMAAARLMLDARVGILRTMPQPDDAAFEAFRLQTRALGRPWTSGRYGDYLRELPRDDPRTLPVLVAAASLFRGAGYVAFDGESPALTTQAAIGAPYAHATAPLRRLVDRWALAICLELSAGRPAPEWARASLAELPGLMRASEQRAARLDAGTVDRVEAALLAPLVGTRLPATVIERRGDERGRIQLAEPVVTASAPLPAAAQPGDVVELLLTASDIARGEVSFAV